MRLSGATMLCHQVMRQSGATKWCDWGVATRGLRLHVFDKLLRPSGATKWCNLVEQLSGTTRRRNYVVQLSGATKYNLNTKLFTFTLT